MITIEKPVTIQAAQVDGDASLCEAPIICALRKRRLNHFLDCLYSMRGSNPKRRGGDEIYMTNTYNIEL